ncbi:unnamed protein product, partial [Laminaria digitata]
MFWELYGSAEEGEGTTGNVVLALDVLGSFDFYSIPPEAGGAHGDGFIAEDYRQDMLGRAMRLLHLHALRCLDDPDK